MAADIKANGQAHPIMLSPDGKTLIDGRNRLRACEIAKVEPKFERLNGQDQVAYIMSANIQRRQMTKGQIAMAAAKASRIVFSENKASKTVRALGESVGVSGGRIAFATLVLEFAPDFADGVLSGAIQLNEAYRVAQERKSAASSTESKMAALRTEAPDLPTPGMSANVKRRQLTPGQRAIAAV